MPDTTAAIQAARDAAAVTRQAVNDYGPGAPETISAARVMVQRTEEARALGVTADQLAD